MFVGPKEGWWPRVHWEGAGLFCAQLSVPAWHGPGFVTLETSSKAVTVTVDTHLPLCRV